MISKELFVKTMNKLESLDDKMSDVDIALHALSPDFGGFYIPDTIEIVMDILKEDLKDKYDFLEYCVYEHDFLHTLKPENVRDENDNPVDLTSWSKVYDFLTDSMEE